MNVHVFVVDATTFKLHLEYMFAGTGAKDKTSPFLNDAEVNYHHSTERNLVGMIADISRVRPGDKIAFYLQATSNNQGMFFGFFKAESTGFFDENDDDNYLIEELGNEVSCGVGMQRIDTMIIEENEREIHLRIVEMKDEEPYNYILDEQLPWYLKWTSQYIIPNLQKCGKEIIIHPCILAKRTENQNMIDRIRNEELIVLNMQNVNVASTEYIGFDITDTEVVFEKIV